MLDGRNALITGASVGLGNEIARQFLREGASVAICARDAAALESAAEHLKPEARPGQKVVWKVCDVSCEEQVGDLVRFALAELGTLHALVNNAGIYGPKGPTESVDMAAWARTIEINLYGALFPCRETIPHFKAAGYGKIITLSGGGATSPMPYSSAYAASKAALVRLMETLAVELKEHRIDVNTLAPGALNTRFLEEVLAAGPEKVGAPAYQKALKQKESGGASLETAARLCTYLASAECDGITGKLISAQWDPWQKLPELRQELQAGDIYTLRRIVPEDRGKNWA